MNETAVACNAFQPITWSKHDTPETIAGVKENNRVWTVLCGKEQVAQ